MLRVSYSSDEAKEALKKAIPAMESGININTSQGDLCLTGEDAKRVMELVRKIAQAHVNAACRSRLFSKKGT